MKHICNCNNHGRRTSSLLVDCPSTADTDWTQRDKLSGKAPGPPGTKGCNLRFKANWWLVTGGILQSPVLNPPCFISLFKAQRIGQCTTARLGVSSTCEEEFICWWAQLVLTESLSGWGNGLSGSLWSPTEANPKPCTCNGTTPCNSTG